MRPIIYCINILTYYWTHTNHNFIEVDEFMHEISFQSKKLCYPLYTKHIYTHTNKATQVVISLRRMKLCT